eukprot:g68639.t1
MILAAAVILADVGDGQFKSESDRVRLQLKFAEPEPERASDSVTRWHCRDTVIKHSRVSRPLGGPRCTAALFSKTTLTQEALLSDEKNLLLESGSAIIQRPAGSGVWLIQSLRHYAAEVHPNLLSRSDGGR